MKRSCVAFVMIAALMMPVTAMGSNASEPAVGTKILDVVVVRPLAMVGSIASTGIAIGLSPLTLMTGMGDESVEYLVAAPWRFTAHRYPGEFAEYKDGRTATGRTTHP